MFVELKLQKQSLVLKEILPLVQQSRIVETGAQVKFLFINIGMDSN